MLAFTESSLNDSERELVILRPSPNGLPFPARDVFCLPMTWPPILGGVAGLYSSSNFLFHNQLPFGTHNHVVMICHLIAMQIIPSCTSPANCLN